MATATGLFESDDLWFAALDCPPDDPEWGEQNLVTHPIVALPSSPVWQVWDRREPELLNANHAVFHHAGAEYRRERFDGRGYRCLFFFPATSLAREVAAEFDPVAAEADAFAFPARSGPLDAQAFRQSRLVARALRSGRTDGATAREGLYAILRAAVAASYAREPVPGRPGTGAAHRALVEEAKSELTRRAPDGISLDGLARSLHTSPYHLARVFRTRTGYSVHGYLQHLRLRTAMEHLTSGWRSDLGSLAAEMGFRTQSHFTDSFRRTFGVVPSAVRRATYGSNR